MYELVIIGGGPGGVAAGVYANASRYAATRVLKPLGFSISATGNSRFPTLSHGINSNFNFEVSCYV